MCIRDSGELAAANPPAVVPCLRVETIGKYDPDEDEFEAKTCLLYTSDAADERSSVDLGGRRIIKTTTIQTAERRRPQ